MPELKTAPLGHIPIPYNFAYTNAAARTGASGFIAGDVGKFARQLDDNTIWMLTATTPTWVQVGGAGALADDSVTNAKLANMAQATIKGRASGAGTGDPTDLTGTQATAVLDAFVGDSGSGGTKGLVPAPASGDATKFLRGDGTFVAVTGGGGGVGDVVGPGSATDNAIARYDGTTGKLIQNSNLTLPDDAASTEVGYMNIPQRSVSTDTTTVMSDRGGHIYHPTSDDNPRTWTIDSNANVAYPIGTVITFVNDQNTVTIAITSDTLVWAEDGSTGSRTLAENGVATALKVTSTRWIISGVGLS